MRPLAPYLGIALAVAVGVALAPHLGVIAVGTVLVLACCVVAALVRRAWRRVIAAIRSHA